MPAKQKPPSKNNQPLTVKTFFRGLFFFTLNSLVELLVVAGRAVVQIVKIAFENVVISAALYFMYSEVRTSFGLPPLSVLDIWFALNVVELVLLTVIP